MLCVALALSAARAAAAESAQLAFRADAKPADPVRSEDPVKALMSIDVAARRAAAKALLAEGPRALPRLLAAIKGRGSRDQVNHLLLQMGRPAIPALVKLLGDPEVGQTAGSLLFGVITPESADQTPALLKCLETLPDVRNYCGTAVVKIAGPKAAAHEPLLRKALGSKVPESRLYAAGALGQLGAAGRPAAQALAGRLADKEPRVRMAAAMALGKIGGQSPIVRKALQQAGQRADETPEIKAELQKALRRWHA